MTKKEYSPKFFTNDIVKFLKKKFPDEWKELQSLTKNRYITPCPPHNPSAPSKTYKKVSEERALHSYISAENLLEEIGKVNIPLDMIQFMVTCEERHGDCESSLKMIIYEEAPTPSYEKLLKDDEARLALHEKEVEKYEKAILLRKEKAIRAMEIEKLFETELKARLN